MKIITICMLKGGTGKSTVSFNIITTRAAMNPNDKYLLIDLDIQANLSNYFGIQTYEKVGKDSSDMILGNVDPEDVVIKSPLDFCRNVDIIPASFNIFRNDIKLNNAIAKEFKLDRVIDKHRDFFEQYDYIIFDTNPSFGVFNINAFYVTDVMINVVKNNCISSLKALEIADTVWNEVKDALGKDKKEIQQVIINMDDDRSNASKQFKEYIYNNEKLNNKFLKNRIRHSVVFVNSILKRMPVYQYDNKHKATNDILNIIKELEENKVFDKKEKN